MTISFGGKNDETVALLAAIVESSHDAIVSKDLNGIVTSWNFGAERIFGYTPEEMIGQSIRRLIPPERMKEEDYILEQIRRGHRIDHFDTVRVRKDGRRIDISLTISPIRSGDGRIIGASKIARDITHRKEAEETQRILMRELNHRSKNLLAVVESIVRQTAANSPPDEFVHRVSSRIQALSANQDLLVSGDWRGVDVKSLVHSHLGLLDRVHREHFTADGKPYLLTPPAAQALGLALHELTTNAMKHGALSNTSGKVDVRWSIQDEDGVPIFRLTWSESGGPPVGLPTRTGFGTTILKNITARSLDGKVSLDYKPDGLVWEISAPAKGILGEMW